MTRRSLHSLVRALGPAATIVATVGALARADAPPGQYSPFDRADQVITDAKTKLIWQRNVALFTDFPGALAYCSALSLAAYTTGWRLPSYKELLTLVDESPHLEYPTGAPQLIAIDPSAFPGTPVSSAAPNYWSSSPDPNKANTNVFVVDFMDGTAAFSTQSGASAWVRCVR